jgi:HEAT repeat protein
MGSAFEMFRRIGPAAFVVKAILAAAVADVLLLGFILLRRAYRKWYFARRDARAFAFRQRWDALISGKIPYESWRTTPFDCAIVEAMVLDALEAAGQRESARLLQFLRASGLIEKQIFEARRRRGWRRHRALVRLGRTRAPEGIPALSEGLRDRVLETRLAALRGLARVACPEAGLEILNWVAEAGLQVPELPLQSVLIQCCAERPQMVLRYLTDANIGTRELLGRVLGEVATASLASESLRFIDDDLPELRAAAARALAHAEPILAIDALTQLAEDSVWFVRLRAVVSLGQLLHPQAIPPLLRSLSDSNRLVRLRGAKALVHSREKRVSIFEQVVALNDRYGLHAYLAALDSAGLRGSLEAELKAAQQTSEQTRDVLLEVLRTGSLPANQLLPQTLTYAAVASRP